MVPVYLSGYHALLSPGYRQTQHNGVFANSPVPPPAMKSFQPGEFPNPRRERGRDVRGNVVKEIDKERWNMR